MRRFPILRHWRPKREQERLGLPPPDAVDFLPWEMIAPHEDQARYNHDQTLERLAERGGLDPREAVAVLTGRRLDWILKADELSAEKELIALVQAWKGGTR